MTKNDYKKAFTVKIIDFMDLLTQPKALSNYVYVSITEVSRMFKTTTNVMSNAILE